MKEKYRVYPGQIEKALRLMEKEGDSYLYYKRGFIYFSYDAPADALYIGYFNRFDDNYNSIMGRIAVAAVRNEKRFC